MLDRKLIAFAYTFLGGVGVVGALATARDPIATRPLLDLPLAANLTLSLALGLALAALAIVSARWLVARYSWAQSLHRELAGVVRGNSDRDLWLIAIASGVGEELLFRGLGTQLLGVVLSSILFGALHQTRGPARWAWALWATLMGFLLAGIFVLTGSLLGAVVAHVLTNAKNLRFVRDHGAPPAPRPLVSV
ncbi:MAG: CPBP family intramembrane metalloprotease [Myxococcales bacterium]|nr:CPBP family intramembrane metalloprotease [Myxococcales bacterium]